MNSVSLPIKTLFDTPMPAYQTPGSVAFDVASRIEVTLPPNETHYLPTGLVVCVPEGFTLLLIGRSSLAKKALILANSIGVIDQDFCGPDDEIQLAVRNLGHQPYQVQKGERLAQGLLVACTQAVFSPHTPNHNSRGGFGSTG